MSAQSEYKRIRKNLLAQIRSLRKKGYDVDITLPSKPKKITYGSVRRLQSIREKIPKVVTYKGHKGFGAYRARKEELKQEREKAKAPAQDEGINWYKDKPKEPETPQEEPVEEPIPEEPEPEPEEEPEPAPEVPAPGPSDYPDYGDEFAGDEEDWEDTEAGEIVYNQLQKMFIDAFEQAERMKNSKNKSVRKEAKRLEDRAAFADSELDQAIEEAGFNQVMDNLAQLPEEILTEAQQIVYYHPAYQAERSSYHWFNLLKFGEMLSEDEARRMDPDNYPDEGENDTFDDDDPLYMNMPF